MLRVKQHGDIVYKIIGAAMEVHRVLNYELLESVYQEALHLGLLDRNIYNGIEQLVQVYYKNHLLVKSYRKDMVVGDIIIELKSVTGLNPRITLNFAIICD